MKHEAHSYIFKWKLAKTKLITHAAKLNAGNPTDSFETQSIKVWHLSLMERDPSQFLLTSECFFEPLYVFVCFHSPAGAPLDIFWFICGENNISIR